MKVSVWSRNAPWVQSYMSGQPISQELIEQSLVTPQIVQPGEVVPAYCILQEYDSASSSPPSVGEWCVVQKADESNFASKVLISLRLMTEIIGEDGTRQIEESSYIVLDLTL